jgi:CARDB
MKAKWKRLAGATAAVAISGLVYVACGGCCVRDGSLVMTPAGLQPIEDIEVGDVVLSYDPVSEAYVPNRVEETYTKVGFSWIETSFAEGPSLEATADHQAYDATDGLYRAVGQVAQFLRLEQDSPPQPELGSSTRRYGFATFRDLRLATYPSNYVANGVLVHNKGGGGGGATGVDTSQIAGTYTLVSGSSTNSLGDTTTFTSGTLTINNTGGWTWSGSGTNSNPGAVDPVFSTAQDLFTAGSGLGPFSGTYTGTDRDSGTFNEASTGTFQATVNTNGTLTATYSGQSTSGVTFNGQLTAQGPGTPDLIAAFAVLNGPTFAQGGQVDYLVDVGSSNAASSNFRVGIYLSTDGTIAPATDTLVDSYNVTTITAGGNQNSGTRSFNLPPGLTGTFTVGCFVDDLTTVSETDENNNTSTSSQITVN